MHPCTHTPSACLPAVGRTRMPPQRATDQDDGVKSGGHCCQVVHHLLGGPEASLRHVSHIQTQLSKDGSGQGGKIRQEAGEEGKHFSSTRTTEFSTHTEAMPAPQSVIPPFPQRHALRGKPTVAPTSTMVQLARSFHLSTTCAHMAALHEHPPSPSALPASR